MLNLHYFPCSPLTTHIDDLYMEMGKLLYHIRVVARPHVNRFPLVVCGHRPHGNGLRVFKVLDRQMGKKPCEHGHRVPDQYQFPQFQTLQTQTVAFIRLPSWLFVHVDVGVHDLQRLVHACGCHRCGHR